MWCRKPHSSRRGGATGGLWRVSAGSRTFRPPTRLPAPRPPKRGPAPRARATETRPDPSVTCSGRQRVSEPPPARLRPPPAGTMGAPRAPLEASAVADAVRFFDHMADLVDPRFYHDEQRDAPNRRFLKKAARAAAAAESKALAKASKRARLDPDAAVSTIALQRSKQAARQAERAAAGGGGGGGGGQPPRGGAAEPGPGSAAAAAAGGGLQLNIASGAARRARWGRGGRGARVRGARPPRCTRAARCTLLRLRLAPPPHLALTPRPPPPAPRPPPAVPRPRALARGAAPAARGAHPGGAHRAPRRGVGRQGREKGRQGRQGEEAPQVAGGPGQGVAAAADREAAQGAARRGQQAVRGRARARSRAWEGKCSARTPAGPALQ
jgi:hypothetical protein